MTSPPTGPASDSGGGSSTLAGRQRRLNNGTLAAGAAAIAVVGGVIGGVIVNALSGSNGGSPSNATVATAASDNRCPAISVADKVLPSVVTLSVGGGGQQGSGSGEIIRGNYILTNDHVISLGANGGTIHVLFSSGQVEPATLVGRSVDLDLAVVKVGSTHDLPPITIGSSESLRVGQPVVAVGAPLGLHGTVTSGIVSALGRDVTVPVSESQNARLPGAIQTDASINPGNSGGALVDCKGHLVGINTAIATVPNAAGQAGGGSVGIGFAIPVDLATVVADQLINTGRYAPPSTGLTTTQIPENVAEQVHMKDGLYVQSVSSGGPAAAAGLRKGDIITSVDGKPIDEPDGLLIATLRKRVGDTIRIEYVRSGTSASATLKLAAGQ